MADQYVPMPAGSHPPTGGIINQVAGGPGTTTSGAPGPGTPAAAAANRRIMDVRDIVRVAAAAGFRGRDLEIAVAIALASSDGDMNTLDTSNVNGTWGPSVGLWRIRTQKAQTGKGGARDINAASEALGNARAAFSLYQARKAKGQKGFEDWPVFTTGKASSYTRRLSDARKAIASIGGEKAVVPEVSARLAAGTPIYYGGPPSSVPAGGHTPRPGEAGFRPEGAQPPAAAPPAHAAPAGAPKSAGGGGVNLGAGGAGAAAFGATTAPAGTSNVLHTGTNLTGAALDDYIRQNYGAMAWALDNPELGPILRQAASEGWDDGRLSAVIETTNWWKTHSATMREIEALRATDPAEFARRIDTTAASLRDRAVAQGITLSIERSREIAEKSVTLGWDDNETNDALAAEYHYNRKDLKGQAASLADSVRQQSRAYGVTVSDGLMGSWVEGVVKGAMTEEDVSTYLKEQAKSRFGWDPGLVKAIDAGISTMDYYSPYINDAASTLELNPATLDLNNPIVLAGISAIDPATGQRRPRSLAEYQSYLRSRPEWDRTKGARAEAAQLVGSLEQRMGVRLG